MQLLLSPFLAAVVLLAVAGAAKIVTPAAAAGALGVLGLPVGRRGVRALGTVELVVAGIGVLAPQRPAGLLVGVAYLGTTAVALAVARRPYIASCGCFGALTSRPGPVQVAVNVAALVVAAGSASGGGTGVAAALGASDAADAAAVVVLAVATATLLLVLLTDDGSHRRTAGVTG